MSVATIITIMGTITTRMLICRLYELEEKHIYMYTIYTNIDGESLKFIDFLYLGWYSHNRLMMFFLVWVVQPSIR